MGVLIDKIKSIEIDDMTVLTYQIDNKIYIGVKWMCENIGLSIGQSRSERKKVQSDIILRQGVSIFKVQTNGGIQSTIFLDINYLPVWLSKINTKRLNDNQYKKVITLLNYCLSDEFNKSKIPTKTYQWEGELRDEIFEIGYFNGYKIIGREVKYSFGRIDLLALDEAGDIVVIELKKDKNYNDTIQQCIDYKNNFKELCNKDVKIVVCTLDDDREFIHRAKELNYEVYQYIRELKLNKVA